MEKCTHNSGCTEQVHDMLTTCPQQNNSFTPQDMTFCLPFFIDEEFKKGKNKERGKAILYCALFIEWLRKNVKKTK